MAIMSCKTRGGGDPKGKPRVYFTCHPKDLSHTLEGIAADLLAAYDCAVYYTEDMAAPILPEERDIDLGQMNLFVVPVTFRLLHEPCRAMTVDLAYAKEVHIPILPILVEEGLDELYSRPEAFGERQYLNRISTDATELAYTEKLRRHLEAVLVGEELAARVRAAFDAYVFLSYRKKDRRYANELMRLVHRIPSCRDIAIWYDEFLTPGEGFRENIARAMRESKLLTLLVTPSLLEEVNGLPNFVAREEYPMAREVGIPILPAEVAPTDRAALERSFCDLPPCVDGADSAALEERLLSLLVDLAKAENDGDPEHNFLIGLAYLEGIDVEVDRDRALALITSAAESGLPEAMKKLYTMCSEAISMPLDYDGALRWATRLYETYRAEYGDRHPDTLAALYELAVAYDNLGDYRRGLHFKTEALEALRSTVGDEAPDTVVALTGLAYSHERLGDYRETIRFAEEALAISRRTEGEEHPHTLTALSALAAAYEGLGQYGSVAAINEDVLAICRRTLGTEHSDTLMAMNNLATSYVHLGRYEEALSLAEEAYDGHRRTLGLGHPRTLTAMVNLAVILGLRGDAERELRITEEAHEEAFRLLGSSHPYTLAIRSNLATTYGLLGDYERQEQLESGCLEGCLAVFGGSHPRYLTALANLAATKRRMGKTEEAIGMGEYALSLHNEVLGEEHPDSLITLSNLATAYADGGEYERAREATERAYTLRCRTLGEEHPDTLRTLMNLAISYHDLGRHTEAAALGERAYGLCCRTLGEEHPTTLMALEDLSAIDTGLGEYRRALSRLETVYRARCRLLGDGHPDTLAAKDGIREVRSILGLPEEEPKPTSLAARVAAWLKKKKE